jgi:glycosyltransferase involved in cell wall biosynthesis
MNTPQLSIVVPVYNAPEDLYRNCLQSLHIQPAENVEFIIVNDGSTQEHCERITKEFAQKDPRFKYFYQDNSGVSTARNLGIQKSRGEYLMFVDSDDTITPDCCDYVLKDVEQARYDCVIYRYARQQDGEMIFNTQNDKPRIELRSEGIRSLIFDAMDRSKMGYYADRSIHISTPWAKLFRKKVIDEYGIKFDSSLKFHEDCLFCMEYYQHSKTIAIDTHQVYNYLFNSESVCRAVSDAYLTMIPKMYCAVQHFADKYYPNDASCQIRIALFLRTTVNLSETNYFIRAQRQKSIFTLAKEFSRLLNEPYIRQKLYLLRTQRIGTPKERFRVFLYTTPLSVPYMIFKCLKYRKRSR